METKPTATIGKPVAEAQPSQEGQIELWKVGKHAAEDFVRKLELAGKPETLTVHWPIMKAGFLTGHATGFDLGVKLGQKLASLPVKEEGLSPQAELDFDPNAEDGCPND